MKVVSGEETGILSAKAMVDLLSSLRELGASDNLVFSKIASMYQRAEFGLGLCKSRLGFFGHGPATGFAGRYWFEFEWRSVGRKLMDRKTHNSACAKHDQAEGLFAISFRQLYNI